MRGILSARLRRPTSIRCSIWQGLTPFNPARVLDTQRKGPNERPILLNGVTSFIISRNMRLPTVEAWNFSIQRPLSNTISVDPAYVGNKGTHVFAGRGGDYDPNQTSLHGFGETSTNQRKPFFQRFGWSQSLRYFASGLTTMLGGKSSQQMFPRQCPPRKNCSGNGGRYAPNP